MKYYFLNREVCRLSIDALSNTEISQEISKHKSTVSRYINRGIEEGKINQQNVQNG